MIIKNLQECKEITALDNTTVRELLNPHHDKENLVLDYSLAYAALGPGESSLAHRFFEASEVYYILNGSGRMHINDKSAEVRPGHMIYIPPKAVQYIDNIGNDNLEFLCIVYPSWQPDAEELV